MPRAPRIREGYYPSPFTEELAVPNTSIELAVLRYYVQYGITPSEFPNGHPALKIGSSDKEYKLVDLDIEYSEVEGLSIWDRLESKSPSPMMPRWFPVQPNDQDHIRLQRYDKYINALHSGYRTGISTVWISEHQPSWPYWKEWYSSLDQSTTMFVDSSTIPYLTAKERQGDMIAWGGFTLDTSSLEKVVHRLMFPNLPSIDRKTLKPFQRFFKGQPLIPAVAAIAILLMDVWSSDESKDMQCRYHHCQHRDYDAIFVFRKSWDSAMMQRWQSSTMRDRLSICNWIEDCSTDGETEVLTVAFAGLGRTWSDIKDSKITAQLRHCRVKVFNDRSMAAAKYCLRQALSAEKQDIVILVHQAFEHPDTGDTIKNIAEEALYNAQLKTDKGHKIESKPTELKTGKKVASKTMKNSKKGKSKTPETSDAGNSNQKETYTPKKLQPYALLLCERPDKLKSYMDRTVSLTPTKNIEGRYKDSGLLAKALRKRYDDKGGRPRQKWREVKLQEGQELHELEHEASDDEDEMSAAHDD